MTLDVNTAETTGDRAVLRGTAFNTDASGVTYWFEYGPTTDYGSSTPVGNTEVPGANVGVPVELPVADLDPATTYHYRLCVRDAKNHGLCAGDKTVTTTENDEAPFVGLYSNAFGEGCIFVHERYSGIAPDFEGQVVGFTIDGCVTILDIISFQGSYQLFGPDGPIDSGTATGELISQGPGGLTVDITLLSDLAGDIKVTGTVEASGGGMGPPNVNLPMSGILSRL